MQLFCSSSKRWARSPTPTACCWIDKSCWVIRSSKAMKSWTKLRPPLAPPPPPPPTPPWRRSSTFVKKKSRSRVCKINSIDNFRPFLDYTSRDKFTFIFKLRNLTIIVHLHWKNHLFYPKTVLWNAPSHPEILRPLVHYKQLAMPSSAWKGVSGTQNEPLWHHLCRAAYVVLQERSINAFVEIFHTSNLHLENKTQKWKNKTGKLLSTESPNLTPHLRGLKSFVKKLWRLVHKGVFYPRFSIKMGYKPWPGVNKLICNYDKSKILSENDCTKIFGPFGWGYIMFFWGVYVVF